MAGVIQASARAYMPLIPKGEQWLAGLQPPRLIYKCSSFMQHIPHFIVCYVEAATCKNSKEEEEGDTKVEIIASVGVFPRQPRESEAPPLAGIFLVDSSTDSLGQLLANEAPRGGPRCLHSIYRAAFGTMLYDEKDCHLYALYSDSFEYDKPFVYCQNERSYPSLIEVCHRDFATLRPTFDENDHSELTTATGCRLRLHHTIITLSHGYDEFEEHVLTMVDSKGKEPIICAIEWLDYNVLIVGMENGEVHLVDMRIELINYSDYTTNAVTANSFRLSFGERISRIKKWDDNHIIVAGANNKMCMYDIRLLNKAHENGKSDDEASTKETVRFQGHSMEHAQQPYAGLDICPALGLVAAGSDVADIRIFDAATGRCLKHIPTMTDFFFGGQADALCLRFWNTDTEDPGATSLLFSAGNSIHSINW